MVDPKLPLPREGVGNFRLYLAVRHPHRNHDLNEGPYRFRSAEQALRWLAGQTHVNVIEAWLWHNEKILAHVDRNGEVGR